MNSPRDGVSDRVPRRTCIGCRVVRPKSDLIRLVRTGSGAVRVDMLAKEAGRGAYLCSLPCCWEAGLKGSRLEKALRATMSKEERARLAEFGRGLAGGRRNAAA